MDYSKFKLLYKGKYGSIYDPCVGRFLICEYSGFWNKKDNDFVKDILKGVELLIKYKAIVDLCDHRKEHVIDPETIDWVTYEWYKKLGENGLKYEVCIAPESVVGKLSHKRLVSSEIIENVKVETFSNDDEAYKACINFLKKHKQI
jgi:hypothetical protein